MRDSQRQEKRNWRKLQSMGTLGALGFLMLFQYQNCAPASSLSAMSSKANGGGSSVSIIDDMNATTGLAFSSSSIQAAPSNQATVVDGSCSADQEKSVLSWAVLDSSGNLMEQGHSVCSGGKFKVEMAPSNEMECGENYLLQASFGASSNGASAEIARDCSTVASSN